MDNNSTRGTFYLHYFSPGCNNRATDSVPVGGKKQHEGSFSRAIYKGQLGQLSGDADIVFRQPGNSTTNNARD